MRKRDWSPSKCGCYRRMLEIKWVDRITNEEVLDKIKENRTMWKNLKRRVQMIKHTLRHSTLLKDILEREMGKKRARSRMEYFP